MVGGRGKHGARVSPRGWPSDRTSRNRSPRPSTQRGRRRHDRTSAAASRSTRIARCSIRSTSTAARITAFDLTGRKELKSAAAGTRPYDVALARNGAQLFVSDWAGRVVRVLDPADLRTVARIAVGEHPNQIAVHPEDDRIFVACASSNCVSVIDTRRGIVTETIHTALFPQGPRGEHARRPGRRARRQDALRRQRRQQLRRRHRHRRARPEPGQGLHPHRLVSDGRRRHARRQDAPGRRRQGATRPGRTRSRSSAAKPSRGEARRDDRRSTDRDPPFPYIGTTLSGALSIVPVPDDKTLAAYTETVYRNCPYSDKLLTDAPYPRKTAIPTKVGDPSPIKHVLYIIKENRTYDQVFGDMPRGNGDPSLVMFGARGDAQPPQAGRGVRPARQPLLQRPRLGRRPSLVDDGLQHRLHRPQLGADLLEPGRDRRRRRRRPVQRPLGLPLGRLRPGRPELPQLRRVRAPGQPAGRLVQDGGAVPGLVGHMCPDYGIAKVPGKRVRDTDNVETSSGNSASTRRTATFPGSWS